MEENEASSDDMEYTSADNASEKKLKNSVSKNILKTKYIQKDINHQV